MFKLANPNPRKYEIDDCVVRAIAIATGHSWDYIRLSLCIYSFDLKGMSSTNFVWDSYLREYRKLQTWQRLDGTLFKPGR